MAINKIPESLTITAAGVTKTYPITDMVQIYDIKMSGGAVALAGNVTISASGTPRTGSSYHFLFGGGCTLGAFTFTIFGVALTAAQCLYEQEIFCYYNIAGTWDVYIKSNDKDATIDIDGGDIVAGSITNTQISASAAIAWTKLAASSGSTRGHVLTTGANGVVTSIVASTSGRFLVGDGTDPILVAMSGDATLAASGAVTLANNAVTTAKITDANVTPSKLTSELLSEVIPVAVSFETGEQAVYGIRMSYAGSVTNVYCKSTKAIAATDDGTIVFKDNAGTTMTVTTPIVFTASDPINTAYSSAVTANNTFIDGDIITVTPTKATAGGKVLVTIEILRS